MNKYFLGGFTGFANPDDLIAKKGLDIYDWMMTDTQVLAAVNYKRFAVVSADWDVLPGAADIRSAEIAAFAKRSLEQIRGSVVQSAFGIMSALVHGYSISELVFTPVESGADAGRWRLEAIKPKHPKDYDFDIDPFGNVTGLWLTDEMGRRSKLPLWKFVIYTYLPEYGRPWGRSDLRAVYRHWWSKDFLLKLRNIYLETQEGLQRVLCDIINNTAITIPDDMDIEFIAAAGEAGFKAAIEYHDRQIEEGIIGQMQTSDERQRVGSLALGEDYMAFLRRDICESVMNEQVIRRLVDFNFADVVKYPKFIFKGKAP